MCGKNNRRRPAGKEKRTGYIVLAVENNGMNGVLKEVIPGKKTIWDIKYVSIAVGE